MVKSFGNTWWGNEWLKALTHIDYTNRIPRGATYARKGAVKNIELKDNVIHATVSGSSPKPYKVSIEVPAFSQKSVNQLMEKLMGQPAILSKLLNRELDPQVLAISEALGLKVFPQRWDDLKMSCSCPDWAVPCKHLAAVVYMLSREIDNDPFLLFSMHGVDLLEELKKRNVGIEKEAVLDVPEMASLLVRRMPKELNNAPEEFHRLDFSKLRDISEPLASLLPKEPAFDPQADFQLLYQTEIGRMSRIARRILDGKIKLSYYFLMGANNELLRNDIVRFEIDADAVVKMSYEYYGVVDRLQHPYNDAFLLALSLLPEDYLSDYHPSVAAMHQTLLCALHLLAMGAVIPQIVKLHSGSYTVRWLPATIDLEVARVMKSMEEILPPMLMMARLPQRKLAVALKNQAECIVSYILGRLISVFSASSMGDRFRELFFKGKRCLFDQVGETTIPGSVRSWLDRFFLSQHKFRPSLLIQEAEKGVFALDVAIDREGEPVLLKDILQDKAMEKQRFVIFKELSLLSSFIQGLEQYINCHGSSPVIYSSDEFVPFLFEVIPAIRLLGVKVMLPKSLQELIRPRVSVKLSKKQTDGMTYLRLDDLLQFDWQVALGDELVSPDKFLKLARRARGLIRFKQQYIYVDESDIARLTKSLEAGHTMSRTEMLQSALTECYGGAKVELSNEVRQLIQELTAQTDIPVPASIQASLRPYQERGFAWMYRNMRIGFGSIIADDMGLGKTLQVITLLQCVKDEGKLDEKKALIVVPTGLVTNWQTELERFAPKLSVFVYHGTQRSLKGFNADILLTTYGVLRSDVARLKKMPWSMVVIDEAQNIKNSDTAQSKAVRSIPADTHIAMSGTPVENRLSEFWSIMDFCNQGYLGTAKQFKEEYANPIQREGDVQLAERFRRITAPFMMRRLKTDKSIINDLPDKVERNELALLTDGQAALYHETLQNAMAAIEAVEDTDQQSLFKRQGLVLQMILALKQICNHPSLFLKNGDFNPELSGKSEMLLSLLESSIESRQKVLVFTQFREMGEMLSSMIEHRFGECPLFLHGGCSINQRQDMVRRFQENPRSDQVFLLSLKAGGTGLNLTAASHVIHYDLWWNPAVEAQATDRAYRIGQHQNVMVHRFITQNTFEERIDRMIQEKRHLADLTVATGESWVGKLSNQELRELFG